VVVAIFNVVALGVGVEVGDVIGAGVEDGVRGVGVGKVAVVGVGEAVGDEVEAAVGVGVEVGVEAGLDNDM
jgi:hypothetical protein